MLYGHLMGGVPVATGEGLPIVETEPPSCPDGFRLEQSWRESSDAITQTWSVVPAEGTPEEAAVALARMMAVSLTDDEALRVPALYDEWSGAGVSYREGTRLLRLGTLYRVLQDHVSQEGWAPEDSPSLFARVLAGQSGEVGEWERPGSENGYAYGSRVTHNGHLWESDFDPDGTLGGNVWEPGTVGSHWVDLGEWPASGGEE